MPSFPKARTSGNQSPGLVAPFNVAPNGYLTRPDGVAATTGFVRLSLGYTELSTSSAGNAVLPSGCRPGEMCMVASPIGAAAVYAPAGGNIINQNSSNSVAYFRVPRNGTVTMVCRGNNNWCAFPSFGFFADLQIDFSNFLIYGGSIDLTSNGGSVIARPNGIIKTADFTTLYVHSNSTYSNAGAAGQVIFTLPNATSTAYCNLKFVVHTAQNVRILCANSDTMNVGGAQGSANGYIESSTVGSTIEFICGFDNTAWIAQSVTGTWSVPT